MNIQCRYNDIINIPYKRSEFHPHMSNLNRAAQFAPFAALAGYDDAVKEVVRQTQMIYESGEYECENLN